MSNQNELDDSSGRQVTRSVRIEQNSFQGPLPHPETLARYNEIVPDAAERILKMAEAQSQHRLLLEKNSLESVVS